MKLVKPLELFQNLVVSGKASPGRLLGLDVGKKYVGLAVSDPSNKVALSLSVEAVQVKHLMELRKTGILNGLWYTYWDESYTSKSVQALLDPLNLHPKTAKLLCDKYAAVGILQGYLDSMQRDMKSGITNQDQWNFGKRLMKR